MTSNFNSATSTLAALRLRCSSALMILVLPEAFSQEYSQRLRQNNHRNHLLLSSSSEENTNTMSIYAQRPELATATMTMPHNATTTTMLRENSAELKNQAQIWIGTLSNFLQQQSSMLFPPSRTTESENDPSFQNQNHSFSTVPQEEQHQLQEKLTSYPTKSEKRGRANEPLPEGPRWAVSHPKVDFTGTWKPIITDAFKEEYDSYLEKCGTSVLFRKVVINFANTTREVIQHAESGRKLHFHGKTPVGSWERTLVSSGADADSSHFEPHHTNFLDPDKERVYVEAWWEDDGTVHKSWLRGKPRVEGGAFESTRYIETCPKTGQDILVCESRFHPSKEHLNDRNSRFQPAVVRWKYHREELDDPK